MTDEQHLALKAYRSLGIFSVRNELLFLMYAGVLCFTTGVGMIVYQNVDSIGHIALLAVIVTLAAGCYYLAYRRAPGFSRGEVSFEHPAFDYVVLTGSLLTAIFFGYLQTQYNALGEGYSIAALATAAVTFYAAYYFDNRSSYAVAITAFAAFVGITATPKAAISNELYTDPTQTYAGLGLSILLAAWYEYSLRNSIKKHFNLITISFALHLIGLCCLKGLFENMWLAFAALLAGATYYFYLKSYETASTTLFVFTMLYAYLGANISFVKVLEQLNLHLLEFLTFLSPAYIVFSIWLFIGLTKRFNKQTNDGEE